MATLTVWKFETADGAGRAERQPGTSALFVLTSGAVLDKVQDAFSATGATLVHSNLSAEQEERLRTVFAAG